MPIIIVLLTITSVLYYFEIVNEKPPIDHMIRFYTPTISKLKYTVLYSVFYLIFTSIEYIIVIIFLKNKTLVSSSYDNLIFKEKSNKQVINEVFGTRVFISLLVINIGVLSNVLSNSFLLLYLIPFYIAHITQHMFLILFFVIEVRSFVFLKKNKTSLFKKYFNLNIINILFVICYFLVAIFVPTPFGF